MAEQRNNCRVCLRYDLNNLQNCFSVFEKYHGFSISEKIQSLTKVKIKKGDGFPGKICSECLLQLETAVMFIRTCQTSNKILQALIKNPNVCKEPIEAPEENDEVVVVADTPDCHSTDASDTELTEDADDASECKKSKAIDLKLICDDCGGSFKSKCKLAVHWKKVHMPTKLICDKCKRAFKTFNAYNIHVYKQTRNCAIAAQSHIEGTGKGRVFHCTECTYNTKRIKDMDAHLTTHTGDRRFQCTDCFKSFTQHSSLQGHRESYHKDYRVETTCHVCGMHFKGRNKYYKHIRIHKPNTIECEVCQKMFKSRSNLLIHMKRHSGVKNFSCESCPATFYTGGELCNHRKKVHLKTKSFNCDMCEYSTYTEKLLLSHRSKHTADNVVCGICGMFVENAEKLVLHEKRHLDKKFCCPHCDKTFLVRDSVRRHILKQHSDIKTPNEEKSKIESAENIKQECPAENKIE